MDPAELVSLRLCEKPSCDYAVTNGLRDVNYILHAMSNQLAAIHPSSQSKTEIGTKLKNSNGEKKLKEINL